ncbi:hypothetical protein H0H93_015735 [Arthromyces matolae]|nr:hypothetical protein H0H93_015735 [Arthromyces matolae]
MADVRGKVRSVAQANAAPSQPKYSPSEPNYWLARVDRVSFKADHLFKGIGARSFIQVLYDEYLQNLSTQSLDDAIDAASHLETRMDRYHGRILQLSGVGDDLKKVEAIQKRVTDAIRGMQEILIYGMGDDIKELKALHSRNKLVFQSLTV